MLSGSNNEGIILYLYFSNDENGRLCIHVLEVHSRISTCRA